MPSLPQQNKERNLVTQFLHSIHYLSSSGNMPYANALNILRAIFEASGQQHLLYLVKPVSYTHLTLPTILLV